jgi:hypothetical protein
MDKSFLFFIAAGMGFLYFVTSFIGDIQKSDDNFRNDEYNLEHKYDQYKSVDTVGQDILNLLGADEATQVATWNSSTLKDEFILLFPDFEAMKLFIKDRIIGKALQAKLKAKVKSVEDKYFAGAITPEEAKLELSKLQ